MLVTEVDDLALCPMQICSIWFRYNYGMAIDEASDGYRKQQCMCGTPNCCGFVGGKTDNRVVERIVGTCHKFIGA